jgi:alanine racemase
MDSREWTHKVAARVWLEIDLGVLRENYRRIARVVSPCQVIGVLKANAYGLGALPIARALHQAGCQRFGVAELNEGFALADVGADVQLLGAVLPEEIEPAVQVGIVLPVGDLTTARQISEAATRLGRQARAHFLVDTGMGRLGVPVARAETLIREAVRLPSVDWEGIYSHFPVAYHSGSEYTGGQMDAFEALLEALAADGIRFDWRHIANSDAVNNFPRAFRAPYNAVRTGINLHGSFDTEGRRALSLEPILTLKTRLAAVRRLPAGASIGYGCTYRLPRETLVGTVSAGYADGLPLALSNRGTLLVDGVPCPVLGRVSMDYTTLSLEGVPNATCGDEVTCLGGRGPTAVSVEDWAQLKGTHSYDIICSFGSRVERRFIDSR